MHAIEGERTGGVKRWLFRFTATWVGTVLLAMGIATSPMTENVALADSECQDDLVYCNIQWSTGEHDSNFYYVRQGTGPGDPLRLNTDDESGTTSYVPDFKFVVRKSDANTERAGTFSIIHEDSGKCVQADAGGDQKLYLADCNDSQAQNWYVQPVIDYTRWRIRHALSNKCVNAWGGLGSGATMGLYDCQNPVQFNERWSLASRFSTEDPPLRELATHRALAMMNKNEENGVVKSAKYTWISDTPATVTTPLRMSPPWTNGTAAPHEQTFEVRNISTWEHTVGGSASLTFTYEVGVAGFLKKAIEAALTAHYSYKYSLATWETDTVKFNVNPGQTGWVAQASLVKTIKGNWEFENDAGDSWTGEGVAVVPAPERTDGRYTQRATCTTDGLYNPICHWTRP